MEMLYRAEYATEHRACRSCRSVIKPGSLSLATLIQSFAHDGKDPNWFHSSCFFVKQHPRSTDEIEFFENIRYEDQQVIRNEVNKFTAVLLPDTGKGNKREASNMGPLSDFGVEYAVSGRAQCVGCRNKIMKDELRVKKIVYHTEVGMKFGGQAFWHHLNCFAAIREDYGFFLSGEKLPGFKHLSEEDQEVVEEALPAVGATKAKKMKPNPKVAKVEDSMEQTIEKQSNEFFKMRDDIKKIFKKKDLKNLLKSNGSGFTDNMEFLLDRCADFLTFGALEKCKKCVNGDLIFSKYGYECKGTENEWVECSNIEQKPLRKKCKIPAALKALLPDYKPNIRDRIIRPAELKVIDPAKEDDEKRVVKVQRQREPLYNMHVVAIGKLSTSKDKLKKKIEKMGGKLVTKLQERIAVVISNEAEVEKMNKRMSEVEELDIQVVAEEFLDAIAKGSPMDTMEKIKTMSICDWGSDPLLRMPPEETKGPRENAAYSRDVKSTTQITLKNGGAVDTQSNLSDIAHVYKHEGVLYSSILTLTDIKQNKNSYFKLQVLQADKGHRYWLFRAQGRIGTSVGSTHTDPYPTVAQAIAEFEKHYEQQTGNKWGNRDAFQKKRGKYYPVEVDYESDVNAKKIDEKSSIPSKLPVPVQDLVKLLFDMDAMQQAMKAFDLDLVKMPLGKLSKKQLKEAYQVLSDLSDLVTSGGSNSKFVGLSNKFYTLVPHNFGMRNAPLVDTLDLIKSKREMVDSLLEIEIAYSMLQADVAEDTNPLDAHYGQLKTDLDPLDHDTDEFKIIQQYVQNTHGSTHAFKLEIEDVFKVKRKGEKKRYKPFKDLHNRQLLWHGSRLTNYVGILCNGLKIAPPNAPASGYMFGKGIYFADMVSKSANYCFASTENDVGLMLLSEVALGDMHTLTAANFISKLPEGKHSTKGIGKTFPEPTMSITREDGVIVPMGTPVVNDELRSSLLYNEYIVYDVDQVNIQFMLKLKFNYKR